VKTEMDLGAVSDFWSSFCVGMDLSVRHQTCFDALGHDSAKD
jgi:hypothetical protein